MKNLYLTIALAILCSLNSNSQCPTFSINAVSGTTVGCVPSTIPLSAVNTSTLTNVTYTWISASTGTATGSSINASSPSATNVYTIIASTTSSTCFVTQTFTITRNSFVPFYSAVFTPSAISCSNPCVAFTPFSTSTVLITFTFTSPPPTQTATVAGALMCVPGTYTMNYVNTLNGCSGVAYANVPTTVVPPATLALASVPMCPGPTVNVTAGTVTNSPNYSYTWSGPSSCTISPANSYSPSVNCIGMYTVFIFNTVNGCYSTNTVNVVACTGMNNLTVSNSQINLFPNPNCGQYNLSCESDVSEIEIYNSIGQKVFSQPVGKGANLINSKNLAKGIYTYFVLNNKLQISKGKLAIE